jgi:hypothetical protein
MIGLGTLASAVGGFLWKGAAYFLDKFFAKKQRVEDEARGMEKQHAADVQATSEIQEGQRDIASQPSLDPASSRRRMRERS